MKHVRFIGVLLAVLLFSVWTVTATMAEEAKRAAPKELPAEGDDDLLQNLEGDA